MLRRRLSGGFLADLAGTYLGHLRISEKADLSRSKLNNEWRTHLLPQALPQSLLRIHLQAARHP